MKQGTIDCSIFFRSKAYCYETLLHTWQRFVVGQGKAVELSGRKVILGDHTLAVKDGRNMPGVVSLHESSETQSKPGYFRGQCWGAIGLLVGSFSACFCCPLQLQIQQGWQHLGLTEEDSKKDPVKLAERLVLMAILFAACHNCPCFLVLDAFFSTGSVFRACRYYSIEHKKPWVEILVKAKKHYVGYFPAPLKPVGRRGRQALYGEKVHLKECFDHPHLFETVECRVYGKIEDIQVMRLTLLWRPIADYVLFVLAVTSKGPIILMSSDLTLSAAHAIELYCARTRIETLFWVLKHLLGAFDFRFWTKSLPRHSRRPFPNRLLKTPQTHQIKTVKACWQSYETFVLCACIAVGLMQFISLNFGNDVWSKHQLYLRTRSRELPSEKTVKQVLVASFTKQFLRLGKNTIIDEISHYFLKVSDEVDDN